MRRYRRYSYSYLSNVRVTNALTGEPMGYIGDLSAGGLRLVSSQPLAIRGCYEMCLHVPEDGGKVREVRVTVVCLWSRRDGRGSSFHMGCSLDRPSAEFEALVAQLKPRRGY